MEMVRELLPVLDDFERALKTDCGSPEYTKGVEMIYTRMFESMKKLGLNRLTRQASLRSAPAPGG